MKIAILSILLVFVLSIFVVGCATKEVKTTKEVQNLFMPKNTAKEEPVKHTYVEVRYEDPYFEPPVIVVNKGTIVDLNFLIKKPLYISIEGFVNDYYETGLVSFKVENAGSYPVICENCDERLLGWLIAK